MADKMQLIISTSQVSMKSTEPFKKPYQQYSQLELFRKFRRTSYAHCSVYEGNNGT